MKDTIFDKLAFALIVFLSPEGVLADWQSCVSVMKEAAVESITCAESLKEGTKYSCGGYLDTVDLMAEAKCQSLFESRIHSEDKYRYREAEYIAPYVKIFVTNSQWILDVIEESK